MIRLVSIKHVVRQHKNHISDRQQSGPSPGFHIGGCNKQKSWGSQQQDNFSMSGTSACKNVKYTKVAIKIVQKPHFEHKKPHHGSKIFDHFLDYY